MIRPDLGGAYVAVISSGRTQNVGQTQALIGPATWFVPNAEKHAYNLAGASETVSALELVAGRNKALEAAFRLNAPCLQVDDDVKKIERIFGKKKKEEITIQDAVTTLLDHLTSSPFKLAGMAPTNNPYFFNPEKPIKTAAFVIGSFSLILPTELRYDPVMRLKEDYDFTCQHFAKYGGVIRDDSLSLDFAHYTNKGGCQNYRTAELEFSAIIRLRSKWGRWISDHPTRENEVLLRLKGTAKVF